MTPTQTIEAVYAAFQRGDIPFILSQLTSDVSWKQSATLPWGGDFKGPDGAAEFFTRLDQSMETTAFRADENFEVGDQVFSFGYYEGKSRATGKVAGTPFLFRWRVTGGKIASYHAYVDTALLLAALA